jgi:phage shock protein C
MVQRNGLFRSRNNRMLGGVAAGLAYNLNSDPTLIRVIFLLLTVFWGGGAVLYVILWIALPEEDIPLFQQPGARASGTETTETEAGAETPGDLRVPRQSNSALLIGIILIAAGAIFLIGRFIPHVHFGDLWPFVLVIAGIVLIVTSFTKSKKF